MISNSILMQDWIKNSNKSLNKRPSIFYSMLSGSKLGYLIYRTRYMIFNALLLTVFNFFEVLLILGTYTQHFISSIFIIKMITTILISFWYAYTEILRDRIRKLTQIGATSDIIRQRSLWIFWGGVLGGIFCILLAVIGILLSKYMLSPYELSFYRLYLGIIIFEFLITFYLKTIYASVYAIIRIYRPLWAVITPVIINLVLMLSLFKTIGFMALIISHLVASTITIILSYIYTHRTLRQINQTYKVRPTKHTLYNLGQVISFEGLMAGLSNIFMQAEYILIVGLCFTYFQNQMQVLYVTIILLEVCYNLPTVLYFDLKKFNSTIEYQLFEPIVKFSLKYMAVISILLWGVFLLVLYYFNFNLNFAIFMFWLFLFRSILSFQQIRAFAQHKYLQIIIEGIVFLATTVILLKFSHINILYELLLMIAVFTIAILIIQWDSKHLIIKDTPIVGNPFSNWVEFYQDLIQPISNNIVFKIKFISTVKFSNVMSIALLIKNNAKNCKILKYDNNNLWVLYDESSSLEKLTTSIIIQAGGDVIEIKVVEKNHELMSIFEKKLQLKVTDSDIFLLPNSSVNLQYLKDKHIDPQTFKKISKILYYKLKVSLYQLYSNNIVELNGIKYKLNPVINPNTFLIQGVLLTILPVRVAIDF